MSGISRKILDRKMRSLLEAFYNGDMPTQIHASSIPVFATAMFGRDGKRAVNRTRASLRRLGVDVENPA